MLSGLRIHPKLIWAESVVASAMPMMQKRHGISLVVGSPSHRSRQPSPPPQLPRLHCAATMRLLTGLAIAALSGLSVAASPEPAEVYILTADRDSFAQTSTPQIPRQVARDILSQRLGNEPLSIDLPDSVDEETSLSHILKYGSTPAPLFEPQQRPKSQLVVVLEGATSEHAKSLRQQVSDSNFKQAFAVSDPPSASANRYLVDVDFKPFSLPCEPSLAINPVDSTCWTRGSLVVKYDALKVN